MTKTALDEGARVRKLLARIETASKEEKRWRDECDKITGIYRDEHEPDATRMASRAVGGDWNVLASNVNIMCPAIFNSQPIPDIRRRYSDDTNQDAERDASEVLARTITIEMEDDSWVEAVRAAVQEMVLYGRGVVRMRYVPEFAPLDEMAETIPDDSPKDTRRAATATSDTEDDDATSPAVQPAPQAEEVVRQGCPLEAVPYTDFRRGPGKRWADVKWIAFRHLLSREEVERMFGEEMADRIPLCHKIEGVDDKEKGEGEVQRDLLRAPVWEMWDKPSRTVIFLSDAVTDGYLRKPDADPLGLEGFYPVPRPIMGDSTGTTLVPLSDYRLYKKQARELEVVSARISAIVRIIKWRGAYDEALVKFSEIVDAADGKLVPVQMPGPGAKLDESVWLWPIDQAVSVLDRLISYRTELKSQIFEILGLWDIIRGASDPNETLGAQKLKTQWGSLRIVNRQAEVQRLCKDLIAMQCECIGEHYDPQYLSMMTGIKVTPEIKALITSDQLRLWLINIETDSTIKADMSGAREEIAAFVSGLSEFITGIGPAVQAGFCPPDVAIDMLTAFSNNFKLGRSADMALTKWGDETRQKVQQQEMQQAAAAGQPAPPTPEQVAAEQKAQSDQQRAEIDRGKLQLDQQRLGLDAAKMQHEMQMTELDKQMQTVAQAHEHDMQRAQVEAQVAPQMTPIFQALAQIAQQLQATAQSMQFAAQALSGASQVMASPRVSTVVRGPDGRIIGSQSQAVPAAPANDGEMPPAFPPMIGNG